MIYIIGDSFTAGDEIADHLLPFWEGYRNDSFVAEKNIPYFNRLNAEMARDPELGNFEKKFREENRWATLLGKLLNKEILNKGHTGKSISNMATMLTQDMAEMLTNNQRPELIIVQLTSLYRFQLAGISLKNKPNISFVDGHAEYLQINPNGTRDFFSKQTPDSDFERIKVLKYLLLEDIDFFYDYLNNLLNMQMLAKCITGKDLLIVRSIFDFSNEINIAKNYPTDSYLKKVYDLLDFHKKYEAIPSMSDIIKSNPKSCFYTRGWHVCHNTHKIFAEKIAEYIKKTNLLDS